MNINKILFIDNNLYNKNAPKIMNVKMDNNVMCYA
jgi:hypothetical protein